MSSKKYAAIPAALALSFVYAMPAVAKTSNPVENVFTNQIVSVENTIENVSDVIQTSMDTIVIDQPEVVETVSEVYQPEITYVVEYTTEPVMTVYQVPVEWVSSSSDAQQINEAQAVYDGALLAYNQALADYEAASQVVKTTKEVEVEVIEEVEDDQGNITTQTRTEVQTVTETSYAGDVDRAAANLDAATAALEQAQANLQAVNTENVVEEVVIEESQAVQEEVLYGASSGVYENISWTVDDDGVLTISGTGSIPQGAPWGSEITRVVIEEGITGIGDEVFDNVSSITSVSLPQTLTTIGYRSFFGCRQLQSIDVPASVESIGNYAFYGCEQLSSVSLQSGLTSIGKYGFYGCRSITQITLPNTVTTMGEYAFHSCDNLVTATLSTSLQAIESHTFFGCKNLSYIIIPDSVTTIGDYAFDSCENLLNLSIGSGVTSIGVSAFYGCNIAEAIIPDSVQTIGVTAFYGNHRLKNVSLPSNLSVIERRTFHGCESLTNIFIPVSVTRIEADAFYDSGLADIYYQGTESQWKSIEIGNYAIADSVRIHYSYDVAPVVEVMHSLSLEGNIGLNFYFCFEDMVTSDPDAKVEFHFGDTTVSYLVKDSAKTRINAMDYHVFTVSVKSTEMTEAIKSTVILSNGEEIHHDTYSVKAYCDEAIALNPSNSLSTLMKALLNYGGYAQKAFNYKTDDLANKDLDNTDVSDVTEAMLEPYAQSTSGTETGLTYSNSSLALESLTTINHTFALDSGYAADDFNFVLNGESLTPVKRGKKCTVSIPNIKANDLDTAYTVTVGGFEITYSALSYAYKAVTSSAASDELKDLVKALYKYNQAANAYFG